MCYYITTYTTLLLYIILRYYYIRDNQVQILYFSIRNIYPPVDIILYICLYIVQNHNSTHAYLHSI